MIVPNKYNVWVDKPGRLNFFIRWVGNRIRNGAMYVSFWGQGIVNFGRVEEWREIDTAKILESWTDSTAEWWRDEKG